MITVPDAGLTAVSDEEQLAFATEQYRLHTRWLSVGREHGGMILSPQQQSVGEQLRRIPCLRAKLTMGDMGNHVGFLSNWG